MIFDCETRLKEVLEKELKSGISTFTDVIVETKEIVMQKFSTEVLKKKKKSFNKG